MAKFTDGEWRAEIHSGVLAVFSDGGTPEFPYYATIASINNWSEQECRANARLIAEAPHMYEALAELVNWFVEQGLNRELPAFRKAQAVLDGVQRRRIRTT